MIGESGCEKCKKEFSGTGIDFSYLTIDEKRIKICFPCRYEYAKKMENSRKSPGCTKCKDEFYACEDCMKKAGFRSKIPMRD